MMRTAFLLFVALELGAGVIFAGMLLASGADPATRGLDQMAGCALLLLLAVTLLPSGYHVFSNARLDAWAVILALVPLAILVALLYMAASR